MFFKNNTKEHFDVLSWCDFLEEEKEFFKDC